MTPKHSNSIILLSLILVAVSNQSFGAEYSAGARAGYSGAPGGGLSFRVSDFAEGLPLDLRFGVERVSREAGDPADARRIFINDATNGVPEKSGRAWTYRFDLCYRLSRLSAPGLSVFGGVRRTEFTGNFKYVGGNEDFDVTSRQWGWGVGIESRFAMNPRTDFVMGGGVDYFAAGTLTGHDTSYSPSGKTVNGRDDYAYADADEAINQPEFNSRVMLGVTYRLSR